MPALPGAPRFDEISRKWLDLAERRLVYFAELYRSGRWQRYYTRERFTVLMRDVIGAVKTWKRLAARCRQERSASGRMKAVPAAMLMALGLAMASHPAASEDLKRGETLLARDCGSCHAVGRGDSPTKDAPAFRTLGLRYPVEALEEALGEGFMSGHPDMPEFKFDADDVGAIIAYLKSIQQR
jgi:cytochrome c